MNFGPDICDILFGTKHSSEDCVENTKHYIPNILIITGIVLILQYLCRTAWVKDILVLGVINVLSLGIILLFVSSIILWHLECKKYNNVIENRLCKKPREPIKDDREMTPRTSVSLSTQPSDEKKE